MPTTRSLFDQLMIFADGGTPAAKPKPTQPRPVIQPVRPAISTFSPVPIPVDRPDITTRPYSAFFIRVVAEYTRIKCKIMLAMYDEARLSSWIRTGCVITAIDEMLSALNELRRAAIQSDEPIDLTCRDGSPDGG